MSRFGKYQIEREGNVFKAYFEGAQNLADTRSYFEELQYKTRGLTKWGLFVHTSECAVGTPDAVEYSLGFLSNLKSLGCVAYTICSKNALVASHADAIKELVQIPFCSSPDIQELEDFIERKLGA